MVEFALFFLINVFDLFIYKRYLDALVGSKRTSILCTISIMLLSAVYLTTVNFINVPFLNLISTILIFVGYIFQYDCRWRTKIVLVSLFLGIGFTMEPVGYLILNLLSNHSSDDTVSCFIAVIFVEVVRAVITEILCRTKRVKMNEVDSLPSEITWVLIIIPALSVISCCIIVRVASMCISQELVVLCLLIALSIIISDYFMLYMIEKYTALVKQKHADAMYQQEMLLKDEFYKEVQDSYHYVQGLKHDLKNQLMYLYDTFSEDGGLAARDKIRELYCDLKEDDKKIYTANPVLNSILKNKTARAEEHEIPISFKVHIPTKLNIDYGDMGILYGNLLDNAIEACQKVDRRKRYIQLESKFAEGMLVIILMNSKEPLLNKNLKTTKKNLKNHGIGLLSVRKVVDKYHGTVTFTDAVDQFVTKAILYSVQALE